MLILCSWRWLFKITFFPRWLPKQYVVCCCCCCCFYSELRPPIALCWGAHYFKHNRNSALGLHPVLAKNHVTLYSCPVLIIDAYTASPSWPLPFCILQRGCIVFCYTCGELSEIILGCVISVFPQLWAVAAGGRLTEAAGPLLGVFYILLMGSSPFAFGLFHMQGPTQAYRFISACYACFNAPCSECSAVSLTHKLSLHPAHLLYVLLIP